jgi:polysaccharide pyruvyl transferase WcaK-like protein
MKDNSRTQKVAAVSRPLPFPAKNALILNFTGNTYHWGCFGTAYEIYQTLSESGYAPSYLSVNCTWNFQPGPETIHQLFDDKFAVHALEVNPILRTTIAEADVVVVNGEGSLHGRSAGSINLLFLARIAKKIFGKPVYLINHSCYPGDDRLPVPESDAIYCAVLRELDGVVAREIHSHEILSRLGIRARLGFDCLPRFIARHCRNVQGPRSMEERKAAPLLVSGGATMNEQSARRLALSVAAKRKSGQPAVYLAGAKSHPAREDAKIYEWMRAALPDLSLRVAGSFAEWIETIANASCLISGRFHHTVAATTLGTPTVTFPSNTPKIEAISKMLDIAPPLSYSDPGFETKVFHGIDRAIADCDASRARRRRDTMLALGEENFRWIEDAAPSK